MVCLIGHVCDSLVAVKEVTTIRGEIRQKGRQNQTQKNPRNINNIKIFSLFQLGRDPLSFSSATTAVCLLQWLPSHGLDNSGGHFGIR